MQISKTKVDKVSGVKFVAEQDGQAAGRAYLYIMSNDLHDEPFGLMEDVFVEETFRGQGIAKALIQEVIAEARTKGCYKLICTSRESNELAHSIYEKSGFKYQGREFRIDFKM